MTAEDFWAGAALVALLAVFYVVGRTVGAIQSAWRARQLAPLAPFIDGTVDSKNACVVGTYRGHEIRLLMTPQQSVGTGDTATRINAFHIEVPGLDRRADWRIEYRVSGLLGQGPKRLHVVTKDHALGARLDASGIIADVASLTAPTTTYVAVAYEPWRKTLSYTGDMSPAKVPSPARLPALLDLVDRLVQLHRAEPASGVAAQPGERSRD